ncbi:MAG: nucleotidyltransferase substrate binding protein [Nitrospinae bacterium]|nr:nucleotidyltransferase substrate binding protein [Nitrospinota bacterium]MBL7019096.1 nucleotidyltransferase substrate binding protein [Nitrospinaceae bacterium]
MFFSNLSRFKINVSEAPPPQKKVLLTHLDWNLQRLDEALKQESTDYFKSAALQRFGHTYTMAIKSISGFGETEDETKKINAEQCIELAKKNGWMEDPPQWQEMIADYKCINQKPDEQEAEAVYQKLPRYQKAFKNLYSHLQSLL